MITSICTTFRQGVCELQAGSTLNSLRTALVCLKYVQKHTKTWQTCFK